jgi:transcription elongation factor Elf1
MEQHKLVKKIWFKCQHCSYQRFGDTILDFEDMVLVKECTNCGGNWKFKCPECSMANKTRKVDLPQ